MIALRVLVVLILHVAILAGMIYTHIERLKAGRELTMTVEPVDPRDFFRGDYVTLTYAISRLTPKENETLEDWQRGDDVFVTLSQSEEGAWIADHLSRELLKNGDAPVIKGRVSWVQRNWTTATEAWAGEFEPNFARPLEVKPDRLCPGGCVEHIAVTYGIESYFVPQGEGRKIEELRNDGKVSIVIAVGDDGAAAIKALLIDGKRVYEETFL
ncbi:MAG: GDYXXLXY domain-containing protein [Alphaproteobacteria bacterium]|nr:GDYXXLXY domain-containing protein [Alphaproteobacteria bacterium]